MRFLTTLYGSQFLSAKKGGKSPEKGRFYGNLLLSALFVLSVVIIVILLSIFDETLSDTAAPKLRHWFGSSEGKYVGRLLALPLLVIFYGAAALFFGRKSQYADYCRKFEAASKSGQKASAKKVMIPFYGLVALLFVLSMISLFR